MSIRLSYHMKNYGDLGGCYLPRPTASTDNTLLDLQEQYPLTAHAPNFDFWTGCREIKRCEESRRTFKNKFASRLAGFNTTIKLLKITGQWYIVPVKFRFGQNLDFTALLLLPLAGGPKDWKHFDADWRLISSASLHTSSDNCERNTQKWNGNNKDSVRKKPLIHGCDWGDPVEGSFAKQNVWQRRVSKLLNESPYGRQNQTNRRYMFRRTSALKS